ncbi:Formate/nitrite transporter family protein [Trichomonas vaginalis G3]|uniref:Formate/nitrite transporter family protein n=1 Tax=Trichomonas vaginalis (strain ATCC PRA-98 / G3) TaxID=412133 RepID=A2EML6_TRIV3|nr:formate/nitrite transporter [Trichomonas vaginalis G3]EAY06086.1 Formate/nitrite transporter family protein [Trichomonas vaginalis G3]KAI5497125.1 formate/nitrite transporter [Trichomonas vaginalis G3]|eukprot:XP_001318309.1 Formate/nitrite transporter family protein [Trichomonas vaginalis G3]
MGDLIPYSEICEKLTNAGVVRCNEPTYNYIVRSFLSGVFISFSFLFGVVATIESGQTIMFALCFAIGLDYILFLNCYLFTGDLVPVVLCALNRRAPDKKLIYALAMTYIFNALGCVFGAFFTGWATGLSSNPYDNWVGQKVAAYCYKKTHMNYGNMFAKAMICNALVSIATFMANMTTSYCGKVLAVFLAIGNFSILGLEHCMANWFCLSNGLMQKDGIKNMTWKATILNLLIVSIGSAVGSCVFVSLPAFLQQYSDRQKALDNASSADMNDSDQKSDEEIKDDAVKV